MNTVFQSLFYWITYSYLSIIFSFEQMCSRFNPYFIGLPILIIPLDLFNGLLNVSFNPYFIGLPILIFSSDVSGA